MIIRNKANEKMLIGVFLIVIIFIFLYVRRESRYNDLLENKETTTGIITEFSYSNYSYILSFEYFVKGIKYKKAIGSSFFRCDDGTDGCVGKKFKVIYSSKDPRNCDIDLGKYNNEKSIEL